MNLYFSMLFISNFIPVILIQRNGFLLEFFNSGVKLKQRVALAQTEIEPKGQCGCNTSVKFWNIPTENQHVPKQGTILKGNESSSNYQFWKGYMLVFRVDIWISAIKTNFHHAKNSQTNHVCVVARWANFNQSPTFEDPNTRRYHTWYISTLSAHRLRQRAKRDKAGNMKYNHSASGLSFEHFKNLTTCHLIFGRIIYLFLTTFHGLDHVMWYHYRSLSCFYVVRFLWTTSKFPDAICWISKKTVDCS